MTYIDLLDSVKTAQLIDYENDWWRPTTLEEQQRSCALAYSEMVIRILHGDTIVLSNNQAVDSVAWLNLAEKICELETPWPSVALSVYGYSDVTNYSVLRAILYDYFSNKDFKLSAWAGIDEPIKALIRENLGRSNQFMFSKMLDNVVTSIGDSELAQAFHIQVTGLEKFFEYLKHREAQNVIFPAKGIGPYIWPRLMKLRDISKVISGKLLDTLSAKAKMQENRSDLYMALEGLRQEEQTEIRKYIDRYYNEKIGLSTNAGRGFYSITDHDPNIPVIQDEQMDAIADHLNHPDGLLLREVLHYDPRVISNYLKWDEIKELVRDVEFRTSAQFLRTTINNYYHLKPESPKYYQAYRKWLGRTFEALNRHHELLAKSLHSSTLKRGNSLIMMIGGGIGAAFGSYLGGHINHAVMGATAGGFLSEVLANTVEKQINIDVIASATAGRMRTKLREAVFVKSDEELLR